MKSGKVIKDLTRFEGVAELMKTPAVKKTKSALAVYTSSAKNTPVKSATPAKATPAKKTPAKSTPAKSTPAKKTPAKSTPAKKTPAKTTPASAKKTPAGSSTPKNKLLSRVAGRTPSSARGRRNSFRDSPTLLREFRSLSGMLLRVSCF